VLALAELAGVVPDPAISADPVAAAGPVDAVAGAGTDAPTTEIESGAGNEPDVVLVVLAPG
jgi:hypothetical protein